MLELVATVQALPTLAIHPRRAVFRLAGVRVRAQLGWVRLRARRGWLVSLA
jgi:hypothetical protein